MASHKENYFYHSIFRKSIIAFGSVFNQLIVKRRKDGDVIDSFKVPVRYGPAQKFIALIEATPQGKRPATSMTMPFVSFEIKGVSYNGQRKVTPTQFYKTSRGPQDETTQAFKQYMPVPYDMQLELVIAANNQDDGLQCLEQILPMFHPSLAVSIVVIDDTNEERDINIVLNPNIVFEDLYEGEFTERRVLQWKLNFIVHTYLFGPLDLQKEIRRVKVDFRRQISRPTELRYAAKAEPTPKLSSGEPTEEYTITEVIEDIHASDNEYFSFE